MAIIGEIYIVTSSGTGHLFPCIQLCNHLSSASYLPTLVAPSAVSVEHHPAVIQITSHARERPTLGTDAQMGSELEAHLFARSNRPESGHPACAIVDFQMGWTKHIFWKFKIPVIRFFTFGACAAAMEWGAWKSGACGVNPGEVHFIPGLPEEMHLKYHDFVKKPLQQPPLSRGGGPPRPGDRPPWVPLVEGSVALMFNTCDDLERPFIKYLATEMGLPVLGVGPLLPNQFWALSNSMIHDVLIRQPKHQSNFSEDQILQWLNKNPEKSVLYVSFGSEVSPTIEESMQLASALEEMPHPFIWVARRISNNKSRNEHLMDIANNAVSNVVKDVKEQRNEWDFLDELTVRVRGRGLIISGWAPQLLILSHPSTGGFLSHCGWNSTMEAIARGVPILAWPIRGDQFYNAKLVVDHLKIGYMAWPSGSMDSVKDDLRRGMKKLMTNQVVRDQADNYRGSLMSSKVALDGLRDFMDMKDLCFTCEDDGSMMWHWIYAMYTWQ